MTETLEYRISVYTVFLYLAALLGAVLVPTIYAVPAAVFILSPVLALLSATELFAVVMAEPMFWTPVILLLLPHAFIGYIIHRDAAEADLTEFWPLTAVLFGLPAVFLYGHRRMRER